MGQRHGDRRRHMLVDAGIPGDRHTADVIDVSGDGLDGLGPPTGHHHPGALRGETAGNGCTDTGAAPGDHCDLAGEPAGQAPRVQARPLSIRFQ